MERPFCICTDPVITTDSGNTNYNIGDRIEAVMTVDGRKPKKIVLLIKNYVNQSDITMSATTPLTHLKYQMPITTCSSTS